VAFACVGEDQPGKWWNRLWNVVFSVRTFGGSLAEAPFHVFVADRAGDDLRRLLEPLGATVHVVPAWRDDYRLANKLRMFEAAPDLGADVVFAIDCDVVVLGDLRGLVDTTKVRVLPAENDRLGEEQWRLLFDHLGMEAPAARVMMARTGRWTYPYWNTGVVTVPAARAAELHRAWDSCLTEMLALGDRLPDPSKAEQRAFAFALQRAGLPVRRLPISANWTHKKRSVPDLYRTEVNPPFVLHYHNKVDAQGFVWQPEHGALVPLVAELNRRRGEALGIEVPPAHRRPFTLRVKGAVRNRTRARELR
jgi:hypothetical protein